MSDLLSNLAKLHQKDFCEEIENICKKYENISSNSSIISVVDGILIKPKNCSSKRLKKIYFGSDNSPSDHNLPSDDSDKDFFKLSPLLKPKTPLCVKNLKNDKHVPGDPTTDFHSKTSQAWNKDWDTQSLLSVNHFKSVEKVSKAIKLNNVYKIDDDSFEDDLFGFSGSSLDDNVLNSDYNSYLSTSSDGGLKGFANQVSNGNQTKQIISFDSPLRLTEKEKNDSPSTTCLDLTRTRPTSRHSNLVSSSCSDSNSHHSNAESLISTNRRSVVKARPKYCNLFSSSCSDFNSDDSDAECSPSITSQNVVKCKSARKCSNLFSSSSSDSTSNDNNAECLSSITRKVVVKARPTRKHTNLFSSSSSYSNSDDSNAENKENQKTARKFEVEQIKTYKSRLQKEARKCFSNNQTFSESASKRKVSPKSLSIASRSSPLPRQSLFDRSLPVKNACSPLPVKNRFSAILSKSPSTVLCSPVRSMTLFDNPISPRLNQGSIFESNNNRKPLRCVDNKSTSKWLPHPQESKFNSLVSQSASKPAKTTKNLESTSFSKLCGSSRKCSVTLPKCQNLSMSLNLDRKSCNFIPHHGYNTRFRKKLISVSDFLEISPDR